MKTKMFLLFSLVITCLNSVSQGNFGDRSYLCHKAVNPALSDGGWNYYTIDENNIKHTPKKDIRVKVIFILDNNGVNNFDSLTDNNPDSTLFSDGYDFADQMITAVNTHLDNNKKMNRPLGNTTPHIPETRFNLKIVDPLKDVIFVRSQYFWQYSGSISAIVDSLGVDEFTHLNIFMHGAGGGGTGAALPQKVYDGGVYKNRIAIQLTGQYGWNGYVNDPHWFLRGQGLVHELAHCLLFAGSDQVAVNDDYSNIYGWTPPDSGNYDCPDTYKDPTDTLYRSPDSTHNNNVLTYNTDQDAWTPCQLGIAHQNLVSRLSNYVIPNCTCLGTETAVIGTGSDIVWDSERYFSGNIVVESGASLEIRCVVGMPAEGRITVEPGGLLHLNGATITNICGDMWRGIEVQGDATKSQLPLSLTNSPQGIVLSTNGTVIEHARDALFTHRWSSSSLQYGGGILLINDTEFRNCRRAAELWPYTNMYQGVHYGNVSHFTNCTFVIDDSLNAPNTMPIPMVTIWGGEGYRFQGNTFKVTFEDFKYRVNGIWSEDGGFKAYRHHLGDSNQFIDMRTAVYASFVNSAKIVKVDRSRFENNVRGVYVIGNYNAVITRNNIDVGPSDPFSGNHFNPTSGIQMHSTLGFQIDENTIGDALSPSAPGHSWGIIVKNSDYTGKDIYRNEISGLLKSIGAEDKNRGLKFHCNEVDEYEFGLLSFGNFLIRHGINPNQGYCVLPYVHNSAGNSFGSILNGGDDIFNVENNNASNDIDYYHSSSNTPASIHDTSTIHLSQCAGSYSCPSHIIEQPSAEEISALVSHANNVAEAMGGASGTDYDVYRHELDMAIGRAVSATLGQVDTIDTVEVDVYDWEAVIDLYELKEGFTDEIDPRHIELMAHMGHYDNAEDKLEDYGEQADYLENYGLYLSTLIGLLEDGYTEYTINGTAETRFRLAAEDSTEYGYTHALEVLNMNFGEEFTLPFSAPDVGGGERRGKPEKNTDPAKTVSDSLLLNAYPNPFKDELTIQVNIHRESSDWHLEVYNQLGSIVHSRALEASNSEIVISAFRESGIYTVTLFDENHNLVKLKRVVKY